jgi:dCTP diphosphatase
MKTLQKDIQKFVEKRDWKKFHSPKNLSMALAGESAEIMEIFQWLTDEQSYNLEDDKLSNLKEEIGDVLIYLINLASKFDIDPIKAAEAKLKLNEIKYPAETVKGKMKKYTEYNKN